MTERDDIVDRLRDCESGYVFRAIVREAADEIERLRRDYSCICREMRRMMEERDEARRVAEQMKWDCFKGESQ